MSRALSLTKMPKSVAEMTDVLGLRLVVKLVEHFGGVELKIPRTLHEGHPLMILGQEDAGALCEYAGSDTILVPVSLMTGQRGELIAKLEKMGFTRWQIAREIGICQRHVRRLANGNKNDRQGELF